MSNAKRDEVIKLLQGHGWTKEQAVGMAANLHAESAFNPAAVGDGGKAYGIAQWHPDRQANFKARFGKPIQGSSLAEQVAFMDYELRHGNERSAGKRLMGARDAASAADIVTRFYERPADTAGESAKRSNLARQWVGQAPVAETRVAPSEAPVGQPAQRPDGWPVLPTARRTGNAGDDLAQRAAVVAGSVAGVAAGAGTESGRAASEAAYLPQVELARRQQSTGVAEAYEAHRVDPRDNPLFTMLDSITQPDEVPPEGWSYASVKDEVETGMSDEEREYLRENGRTGPEALERAKNQIAYRRDLDQTYGDAGVGANLAASLAVGVTDPVGFVLGLGAGKVLKLGGVGSRALAQAQRPTAAAASFVAENAAANAAWEGVQDYLGEVKTLGDYAMAATTGAAMSLPFVRGAIRPEPGSLPDVDRVTDDFLNQAGDVETRVVREQIDAGDRVRAEKPDLDPAGLAREVEQRQMQDVVDTVSEGRQRPSNLDQVVPEDVGRDLRDLTEGRIKPEEPTAVTPEVEPVSRVDYLRAQADEAERLGFTDVAANYRTEADRLAGGSRTVEPPVTPPVTPEPVVPPTPNQRPTLPRDLQGAKPRYGYGRKLFGLEFASDLDKAAYIVGQTKRSKRDADYLRWAMEQFGMTAEQVREHSRKVRNQINSQARDAEDSGTLSIAEVERGTPEVVTTPPPREVPAEATPTTPAMGTPRAQQAPKTVGELLQRLVDTSPLSVAHKALARLLLGYNKGFLFASVEMRPGIRRGFYASRLGQEEVSQVVLPGRPENLLHPDHALVALHEAAHAATWHRIEAVISGQADGLVADGAMTTAQVKAVRDLEGLMGRFREALVEKYGPEQPASGGEAGSAARAHYLAHYAQTNLHEFAAQVFSDPNTRDLLRSMPGKPVAGKASSLWAEARNILARILGFTSKDGLGEAMRLLDIIIAGPPVTVNSPANGVYAPMPPTQIAALQRKGAARIVQHAIDFVQRNPIDTSRLNVLTQRIGGLSAGLRLAGSQNPVMQMVASLVSETTTGAAGRKPNVALRSDVLNRHFMGNTQPEYDGHFGDWAAAKGVKASDKYITGESRREFDRAVYMEIFHRRDPNYATPGTVHPSVKRAADMLETGVFERTRAAQVEAGTLGSGALPTSSRGYIPQALDGAKLAALDVADLHLLHQELSSQFQSTYGWDKSFTDAFAALYTERVRLRAQGSKGFDATSAGGNNSQVIRDTLEDMAQDPSLRDRAEAAMSKLRPGHTKHRLGVDMDVELRPGLTVADLYVTDPMLLARNYSMRNAGYVAMADAGILGPQGLRQLRDAATTPMEGNPAPTKAELEAFDQVFAEILGTPVEGRVVSTGASNLRLAVNLQKLGGLVWTQAAETFGMAMSLGLRSVLDGVPTLPRMLSEVRAMVRGEKPNNPILGTMELPGAEYGTEGYRMVAPLDPPDAMLSEYTSQPGLVTRLLRAGSHLQTVLTGYRALIGAQHRMVAEQVVLRSLQFIRDGGKEVSLNDMGITPEIAAAMKSDFDRVVTLDAQGRIVAVDMTQVSDPRIGEAYIQAVHRGTSQIIQQTFAGERGAWFHNDYLRTIFQLRTFGLTATEKQWGRQRMNYGYAAAAGMLLAQMTMALPLHFARVQANAVGREDKEKFLEDNLNPAALFRAAMNYASMSGLMGDALELASGVAAGWGGSEVGELVGARQQTMSTGRIVPALGTIDGALRVATGKASAYDAVKQLPGSSIWYLLPAMNLLKEE